MNPGATPTGKLRKPTLAEWGRAALWSACLLGYACLTTCSPRPSLLEAIQASGSLKVATINAPTTYYVGASGPTGFDYDLAKGFADALGVKLEMEVVDGPAQALQWVHEGRVQMAAAGLGVSPERAKLVRFSEPVMSVVPQLVYGMGQPRPKSIGDLQGRLRVPRGSIQAEQLRMLKKTQYPDLVWEETDDQDTEELLYQVAKEQLHYTIANSDIIAINQRYYPKLRVAFDLLDSQDLAWAFPLGPDASLYNAATSYLRDTSGAELARLRDRYFGHVEQVDYVGAVTLAVDTQSRLPRFRPIFEKAGARYEIDWRLLAAMGYQESHWNTAAVSPTGVRGIMMLTLDTANQLKIVDREDPVQSIWGGTRYFRGIMDKLPPEIVEPERTWMALAAYNMGIGHLLDARDLTRKLGADPNRWLDVRNSLPLLTQPKHYTKLKYGYARGFEAVNYVGNVRTYFDMLVWITNGSQGTAPELQEEPPLELNRGKEKKDVLDINTPVL